MLNEICIMPWNPLMKMHNVWMHGKQIHGKCNVSMPCGLDARDCADVGMQFATDAYPVASAGPVQTGWLQMAVSCSRA